MVPMRVWEKKPCIVVSTECLEAIYLPQIYISYQRNTAL